MSRQHDDGGPAFPFWDAMAEGANPGMTLRDWFAGQALSGELASQSGNAGEYATNISPCLLEDRAAMLWRFADAMIAAREKGQQ